MLVHVLAAGVWFGTLRPLIAYTYTNPCSVPTRGTTAMAGAQTIYSDVQFDYGAAAQLAEELRSAARVVDHQSGERSRVGTKAKEEWRGVYRGHFDQRLSTCLTDGQALADQLRRAASRLEQAAIDARAEQARRVQARQED